MCGAMLPVASSSSSSSFQSLRDKYIFSFLSFYFVTCPQSKRLSEHFHSICFFIFGFASEEVKFVVVYFVARQHQRSESFIQ